MYETVVWVGAGTAFIGAAFESFSKRKYMLLTTSVLASLALVLADCFPLVLDPNMRPLEPVLRNNFWLVTHVLTVTLSYSAFAVALGLGDITLGFFLVGAGNRPLVAELSRLT